MGAEKVSAQGSRAKVITAAAAFQYARLTPASSYVVPDAMNWHGAWYHDAEPHKTQRYTIAGIIAHSLNDGMIQVADHVTPTEQDRMFRALGIGSDAGLKLPCATSGLLAPPKHWTGGGRETPRPKIVCPTARGVGLVRADASRPHRLQSA